MLVALNSPEISVLMPTYNYASFLPEAIESVLAQEFRDFELLIIDDCSSDNTAEVVRPFCVRDSRVQFSVNPKNLGMVQNWNQCLQRARGRHIKFLFGDDKLAHSQALGRMLALLQNNPGAILAASARLILDQQSNVTDIWRPLPDGCHKGREVIAACLTENGNLIGEPSAVLFRKADAKRGFDPKYRQIVDAEMWFHLLERGDLVYTRDPLCAFRQHSRQQSVVNDSLGLARKELLMFYGGYAAQPGFSRKVRFSVLFALRRSRHRNPGSADAALMDEERRLARQLGAGWYWLHWMRHRLTRPFSNLIRSVEKASTIRCGPLAARSTFVSPTTQ
jgi:glycosyltransferase involved in cell wall biosynthesis